MEAPNAQDLVHVLRDHKAGANQRNDSRRKRPGTNPCRSRRDYLQLPVQMSGKWQHQQSCQH
jgi:hypothetical protein